MLSVGGTYMLQFLAVMGGLKVYHVCGTWFAEYVYLKSIVLPRKCQIQEICSHHCGYSDP